MSSSILVLKEHSTDLAYFKSEYLEIRNIQGAYTNITSTQSVIFMY